MSEVAGAVGSKMFKLMDGEAIGAGCPGVTGVSDCRNYRLRGERVSSPV